MATDADVDKTMSSTNDATVQKVMGTDAAINLSFSGSPTSGINYVNVKFTDASTVTNVKVQKTMTAA